MTPHTAARPVVPVAPPVEAQLLDALLAASPQPTCVFDPATCAFLAVNDAAVAEYGYTREEFLAMDVLRIRPPEDAAWVMPMVRAFTLGARARMASRHLRRDGTLLEVEMALSDVLHDGQPARLAVITPLPPRRAPDATVPAPSTAIWPAPPAPAPPHAALSARTERLAAVIAMQQEVATSEASLADVLTRVATEAQRLTGADGAVVALLEGTELVYRAAAGSAAGMEGLRVGAEAGISGHCVTRIQPLWCDDAGSQGGAGAAGVPRLGARSIIAVPLIGHTRCSGVLKVFAWQEGRFSSEDVHVLQLQAGLLGATIDRAQAVDALAASEGRFRNAFQHAGIGMAMVGLDGRFMRVNAALCRITGYPADELLACTFQDITHPDDLENDLALLRRMVTGEIESYQMEKRYVRKDGQHVWILLTASCVRDRAGQPIDFVAQVQDISERKALEAELRRQATELARSNTELERFASVASHDLQEPLRKIQAFGDRLATRWGGTLPPDAQEYLGRMRNAAGRMHDLIHELLAYSRIATKGQAFVPVDLAEVAREVAGDLEVRIAQSGAQLVLGDLPVVHADRLQMRQLLQNLLGNALKFRRADVAPVVRVDACHRPGDGHAAVVELRVTDNGIGFDERYCDRIFAPFQRLHGRGEYEGTGMGLAICLRIAERHGGTITAHSRPGEGAAFVVTLGAAPTAADARPSEPGTVPR